jgi:hypothetical protein
MKLMISVVLILLAFKHTSSPKPKVCNPSDIIQTYYRLQYSIEPCKIDPISAKDLTVNVVYNTLSAELVFFKTNINGQKGSTLQNYEGLTQIVFDMMYLVYQLIIRYDAIHLQVIYAPLNSLKTTSTLMDFKALQKDETIKLFDNLVNRSNELREQYINDLQVKWKVFFGIRVKKLTNHENDIIDFMRELTKQQKEYSEESLKFMNTEN